MAALSEEVAETAILTAPCGLEGIVLHVVETDRHSVRLSYARYRRAPMHRGASGKILAAYLEPEERSRLLAAVGDPELAAELDRIRAAGYAFTAGELDEGAAAVAAPILDRRGRIAAGLSVAGPEQRVAADPRRLRAAVAAAAEAIEAAHPG
jgi:DNA-binding IclR family transcriptional regulator